LFERAVTGGEVLTRPEPPTAAASLDANATPRDGQAIDIPIRTKWSSLLKTNKVRDIMQKDVLSHKQVELCEKTLGFFGPEGAFYELYSEKIA